MWEAILSWWSVHFLSASMQAAGLVAVAALLGVLLRRSDPRVRHVLWLAVVVRLLVPWDLQSPIGLLGWDLQTPVASEDVVRASVVRPDPFAAESAEPRGGASQLPTAAAGPDRTLGFLTLGVGAWLLGVLVSVVAFFWSALRLVADARSSPHELLTERASALADEHGVRPKPEVMISQRGQGPLLTGLRSPRILIPEEALSWQRCELEAALLHELAHLQRRDQWVAPLLAAARALHWFNPLAWYAVRQVAVEREQCCDDWVLRRTTVPEEYTRALLRGGLPNRSAAAVSMVAPRSRLLSRVRRVLSPDYQPPRSKHLVTVSALAILGWASLSLASSSVEDGPKAQSIEHRLSMAERVSARTFMVGYYLSDGAGELGERREWSGASGLSRPERRWVEVLPELPEELSSLYQAKLRLGKQGEILALEVEPVEDSADDGLADDGLAGDGLAEILEEAVQALGWQPVVHTVHGPVVADLGINIEIRPATEVETLRPAKRAAVGHLTGWIVENEHGLQSAERPSTMDTPVQLVGTDDFRSLGAWQAAFYGDYGLSLRVSLDGEVQESDWHAMPRRIRLNWDEGPNLEELLARLESWSRELLFEPLQADSAGVVAAVISIDLRLDAEGFSLIEYRAPTDDWQEAFYSAYRLSPGETLKLLPGPPIPERLEFLRAFHPDVVRRRPQGPSVLGLQVVAGEIDRQTVRSSCYGGCDLFGADFGLPPGGSAFGPISHLLGVEIDVEGAVGRIGSGDFVVRAEATGEELLDDFLLEAERITGVPLVWERVVENLPAVVLRGRLGELAREPRLRNQRVVHLFVGELEDDLEVSSGFARGTDAETLRMTLSSALDLPVIDETVGPSIDDGYAVRTDRSAVRTELMAELLANVQAQTELEIEVTEMPVERIVIRPRATTSDG